MKDRNLVKKSWYLAPTALNGVVSIASVPVLIYSIGADGWAEIALGQAVGLFGSVLVSLGWPVVGPALIANSSVSEQGRHFNVSLYARVLVALLVVVLISTTILILYPERTLLLWTALASTALGCASSWYFLGIDDPRSLFWVDAFIRSMGTIVGLLGVVATGTGELFAGGLVLGLVLSIVLTLRKVQERTAEKLNRPTMSEVLRSVRVQSKGLGTNVLYVTLSSIALPLSAVIGGNVFVVFAVVDKVQKQLMSVALPLTQLITGKMAGDLGRGSGAVETAGRMFRSVIISGLILILLMIPLGPVVISVLSIGLVSVTFVESLLLAAAVGLAFISQCLPIAVLAPINKLRYAIVGMGIGLIFGIPSILYGGHRFGLPMLLLSVVGMYLIPILTSSWAIISAKRVNNSSSQAGTAPMFKEANDGA